MGNDMVSPISAINSRAPAVQALSRVAPVTPQGNATEASAAQTGSTAAAPGPALSPGAREALAAGYRNLALPLGAADGGTELAGMSGSAGESPLAAAYGPSESALAGLPRLIGSRLPTKAVVGEAQAALRARAEAQGQTPAEFLDSAAVVPGAKLPSRNAPDAEATLRASLLARDGERETTTIDIYLTKTGSFSFEAVAYDRDFAAPAGGFPYSAPPLAFDRLVFDPTYEAIVSIASGLASTKTTVEPTERRRMALGRLLVAAVIVAATLLAVAVSLGAERPFAAAAAGGFGLCALAYALRSRLCG